MNLISDRWIPTTTGHCSLSETLQQAAYCELQLEGMQFAGILRLLLAICYEGDETSAKLLKRKSVSQRTLDCLARHHDMFELESGFLICNDLAGQSDSLNRLIPTAPARNNRVFHVHARDDRPIAMAPGAVSRNLIAYQLAALDFGRSITGPRHHSPCATAAMGIAVGKNLLETLALNLVPDQAVATPSWHRPRVSMKCFLNLTRSEPHSIAERYSWVAQAVRLNGSGVISARGFKLSALGDPMTATAANKDGEQFAPKPSKSNAWLTGCTLLGLRAKPAATLEHAERLGLPHAVRVIAQVNDSSRAAVLVESFDQVFSRVSLRVELAMQVLQVHSRVTKSYGADTAAVFLSYVEDEILEGNNQPDLKAILNRLLEDTGSSLPLPKVTAWLEDEEMNSTFVSYLRSLRPDQLKRIRHAWKLGSARIEIDHPPMMGWTRYLRLPRLITTGVFAIHAQTGLTNFIPAICQHLEEATLEKAIQGSLENLEGSIRQWVKWIPNQTGLNHTRLLLDLCNWDHPKRITQKRWARELKRGKS